MIADHFRSYLIISQSWSIEDHIFWNNCWSQGRHLVPTIGGSQKYLLDKGALKNLKSVIFSVCEEYWGGAWALLSWERPPIFFEGGLEPPGMVPLADHIALALTNPEILILKVNFKFFCTHFAEERKWSWVIVDHIMAKWSWLIVEHKNVIRPGSGYRHS